MLYTFIYMQTTTALIKSFHQQLLEASIYFQEYIFTADPELLQQKPNTGGWSVIEILAHLNCYSRWYLPKLETAFQQSSRKNLASQPYFKSGWLGAYFIRIMQPQSDGSITKKMKSPKNAIPASALNVEEVLAEFEQHLHHLKSILQMAHKVDLVHTSVITSLASFIRLKSGDAIGFYLAHMTRHIWQIKKLT